MKNLRASLLLIVLFYGCNPPISKTSSLSKNWELEEVPNSLDKVGTVFGQNGKFRKYIGTVDLKIDGGTGVVPTRSITKQFTVGAFLDFMKVKSVDSAAVGFGDTLTTTTEFNVNNAYYGRVNDDIQKAFNQQKGLIINNMNAYDYKVKDLYFIAEILRSPSVNIYIKKTNRGKGSVGGVISKVLALKNTGITINNSDSTSITYNMGDSLTVAYVLYRVTAKILPAKGQDKSKVVDLNLISN